MPCTIRASLSRQEFPIKSFFHRCVKAFVFFFPAPPEIADEGFGAGAVGRHLPGREGRARDHTVGI